MFAGHLPELVIVLVILAVLVGGYLLVRTAARTAAREYARARLEEERKQREQPR